MQIYTPKAEPTRMSIWNGGQDEDVVRELQEYGYTVVFQQSPVATEKDWDEAKGEEIDIPAQGRLVAVGKYNWDTLHFAPGHYIVFRLVNIETGEKVDWNEENLADPANKVAIYDRDADSVKKNYDLLG